MEQQGKAALGDGQSANKSANYRWIWKLCWRRDGRNSDPGASSWLAVPLFHGSHVVNCKVQALCSPHPDWPCVHGWMARRAWGSTPKQGIQARSETGRHDLLALGPAVTGGWMAGWCGDMALQQKQASGRYGFGLIMMHLPKEMITKPPTAFGKRENGNL